MVEIVAFDAFLYFCHFLIDLICFQVFLQLQLVFLEEDILQKGGFLFVVFS